MLKIKGIIFWLIPVICGVIVSVLRGYDLMYCAFCVLVRIVYCAVARADRKSHIIPNKLLIILMGIELLWLAFSRDCEMLKNSLTAVVCIAIAELAVYLVSRAVKRDDAMGFGDYKYLLTLGFTCGINNLFAVLLCSLAVALLTFMVKGFSTKEKIAVAPYLSIGAILFG